MAGQGLKLALGADHAGAALRDVIADHLMRQGHSVRVVGHQGQGASDYPDSASEVCALVRDSQCDMGILCCGTGLGVSMAANAITGMRAALCFNEFMARMARTHNDANILCLGERVVGVGTALSIVDLFLSTSFAGGRHVGRLEKLARLRTCG